MSFLLSSDRLRLRPMNPDDIDEMAHLLGDAEVMAFYPRPKSRQEGENWIQRNIDSYEQNDFGLWVIELLATGEFVGECGLTVQVVDGISEVELGYHVHTRFWSQGYATEASLLCLEYARTKLDLTRVIGLMVPENLASQRVAEKAGLSFDRYGDHNDNRDVVMKIEFS